QPHDQYKRCSCETSDIVSDLHLVFLGELPHRRSPRLVAWKCEGEFVRRSLSGLAVAAPRRTTGEDYRFFVGGPEIRDGSLRAPPPADHAATCARERKPSLLRICSTWYSAVRGENKSRSAISRLLSPAA